MGVSQAAGRAVFLDRDGVINLPIVRAGLPHPPHHPDELVLAPDVPEALRRLRRAGFRLVVVTNQPDVARGTQRREVVEAMHARLASELPIDEIRVCYHDDGDECGCRKPKPGMLEASAREGGFDLAGSFMVGDRWRDIEAGRRAGCSTVLVDRGYVERVAVEPDVVVRSLSEAADWILSPRRTRRR